MTEIRYYARFSDDFVKTRNQSYKLPKNYRFIHKNPIYIFFSYLVYYFALIFAFFYKKCALKATIASGKALSSRGAKVVYSNHTMSLGDVLMPFIYCFPRRPYIICDSSNLGIPVIGKFLPLAGAIPIPDTIRKTKEFSDAVETRLKQGKTLVVYPEAHLWPYCTFIRPLNSAAFRYPAAFTEEKIPVYTATTTFHPPKIWQKAPKSGEHGPKSGKKPHIEIILGGPFSSKKSTRKERELDLKKQVEKSLKKNAKKNTYEPIRYTKKPAKKRKGQR